MIRTQRRQAGRDRRARAEQEIVDSARSLLAAHRFRDLSIDDVMAGAGLTRTAFYRYFPDLESVLQRLLDEARDDLTMQAGGWLEGGAGAEAEALAAALKGFVAAYARHARTFRAVMDAAAFDEDVEAAYHEMVHGFIDAVAARIDHGDPDAPSTAGALVWMTERYLAETLGRDPAADPGSVAATLVLIWQRALYP
jgi:AcrR family transcriptional regulator